MADILPKLVDGFSTLEGGMDSGLDSGLLKPNQCAFAINATMRGGLIRNRPPFRKRVLTFADGTTQTRFQGGLFQHAAVYKPDFGPEHLLLQISGRTFKVNIEQDYSVLDISIDPNPSNRLGVWSAQGELFLVIQDGQSRPLIYNGASLRRARSGEIQTGTVIAYVNGRFWYATANGTGFRATDLVGSSSGTLLYGFRDAPLKETENTYLNEGGDFAVPANSGGITAMRELAQLDTSLGQGPLQVFTQNSVFSVNAPIDRTVWKDVQYPIQTVSCLGSGALSQLSAVQVNSDIFYRATDGIRPLIVARRAFRSWSNTPMSFEMSRVLDNDQPDLLSFSSAVNFDNRLLMTASPGWSYHGVYHRCLISLDTSPLASMQYQLQPAYEGIWTGVRILQILRTTDRCFLIVLGVTDKIELWEILKDGDLDYDGTQPIEWAIESRSMEFGEGGSRKQLHSAQTAYDQLFGTTQFNLQYRIDDAPCWEDWTNWTECFSQCATGCGAITPMQRGWRPKKILSPPEEKALATGQNVLWLTSIQCRLTVTGPARLKDFRVKMTPKAERTQGECDSDECIAIQCCPPNPFSYQSNPNSGGDDDGGGGDDDGGGGGGGGGEDDGGGGGEDDGGGGEDVTPPVNPPVNPPLPDDPPVDPPDPPEDPGEPVWGTEPETASSFFVSFWTLGGNERILGISDPADLQPGIQDQWADHAWQQWQDFKAANGLSVTSEFLAWHVAQPSDFHVNANAIFSLGTSSWIPGWSTELWVFYTT